MLTAGPDLLRLILSIMLLSCAQKVTHYAQHYDHNYCNYATVHIQFILF